MVNGTDLVNLIVDFIKGNHLEKVEMADVFEDFTFSVYLDDAHHDEIEYTFDTEQLEETIKHLVWDIDDGEDCHSFEITRQEALELRGLVKKPNPNSCRARRIIGNEDKNND